MEENIIHCSDINLADPRLGTKVVFATDDFFADKSRLINPAAPVFIPDKYDENGKWMDGWESRRKREAGYDFCIIRLGVPAYIKYFDIDTSHFTGNFAPGASIDACFSKAEVPAEDVSWVPLVSPRSLGGNTIISAICENQITAFTHIRLNIFPDGGVARLRAYGQVAATPAQATDGPKDVASILNGAKAVACNDQHFGALQNILMPEPPLNMGDGWETRRRRMPGNDWGIIKLAETCEVRHINIDTSHFKGNFPHQICIQAAPETDIPPQALVAQSIFWADLLPAQHLGMDQQHRFEAEILPHHSIRFIRLNLIPDGGIGRIRMYTHK